MNTTPSVHAMIVAAGRGSRFGSDLPKQYTSLNGYTLLQHSVARLSTSHDIQTCLLVLAADDTTAMTLSFALPVWYAIGGEERWQSVLAGLIAIIEKGAADDDLILIHDAARPAVTRQDIKAVIDAAKKEPYGAILATAVVDTLKRSQLQSHALKPSLRPTDVLTGKTPSNYALQTYAVQTIDRSEIWQAQTPQVFRVVQLRRVLEHVESHSLEITDEASAFEHLQLPIRLVNGSRHNIKLTYPEDALLLSAILNVPH